MTLAQIARDAGLTVVPATVTPVPGPWTPLGVIVHHTAGAETGDMPSLGVLQRGVPKVPGPLAQYGLGRSGKVYVVSEGKAYHAGKGSSAVLARLRANDPPGSHGGLNDTDGNPWFVGIEIENQGNGQAFPEVQLDALRALLAGLCRTFVWNPNRIIAHREWTDRKIDPRGIDMNRLRADVRGQLTGGVVTEAQMKELKDHITAAVRVTVSAVLFGSNAKDEGKWLRDDVAPWTEPLPNLRAIAAKVGTGTSDGGTVDVAAIAKAVNDDAAARLKA